MRNLLLLLVFAALAGCSPDGGDKNAEIGPSQESPSTSVSPDSVDALKKNLSVNLPGVPIDHVGETPIEGIYEIRSGLTFGYVSADGRYLIAGDLNDIANGVSLTEVSRRGLRQDRLAALPEDQGILYSPSKPARYTVTVFTDIDCGYCRKLHQHIEEYNRDGIAVRYLFYPRSGPGTESFEKAEKVWCAEDRNSALTAAKLGGGYDGDDSCANPILDQFKLGSELGVRGTPAIFLPDGEMVPGYRTPEQLLGDLGAMAGS